MFLLVHVLPGSSRAGVASGQPASFLYFVQQTNITELVGPQSGCDLHRGVIKVDGLQFSKSGATLESFRFVDSTGTQWSIPTNIENFSNAEKRVANSFIRVGRAYFVIFAVCGSGGFPSLVEIVDVAAIKPL